jgi:hypothetical protein
MAAIQELRGKAGKGRNFIIKDDHGVKTLEWCETKYVGSVTVPLKRETDVRALFEEIKLNGFISSETLRLVSAT